MKAGLKSDPEINTRILDIFEECGGTEKIEALQDADNPNIYNRAYKILTTYFNIDDDQDDSAMAPQVQGNQFAFGNNPNNLTGYVVTHG